MSSEYRLTEQSENSVTIEYQEVCDCGNTVNSSLLMLLVLLEKPILYNDVGYICEQCGALSEGQAFGIYSQFTSRVIQMVEGVWFLTIILPDTSARDRFGNLISSEFKELDSPLTLFQASATEIIVTGARLEMSYFQQYLKLISIDSNLLSKLEWLSQQKFMITPQC